MFNLLQMDIRRLYHSRNFYIILGVTAALILALVALVSTVTDQRVLDAMQSQGAEIDASEYEMRAEFEAMTQLEFAHECLGSGFLLLLGGIGVTLLVHSDFSSGYIKNICFARPRRRDYVLCKILLAGVYSGVLVVLGVAVSLACPPLFGLHPAASSLWGILQYAFWLWMPCWAFGLMGLALTLLTRSSTLGIIMAVISGGGVTVAVLRTVCRQLGWPALEQYLLSSVAQFQCTPLPGRSEMVMILGCSLGWAAFYAAAGLAVMAKHDI